MLSEVDMIRLATGFAAIESAVKGFVASVQPVMQAMHDFARRMEFFVEKSITPDQAATVEHNVRRAARATLVALGRPVRLSCLRQRLRELGAEDVVETSGIARRHVVVRLAADAPEGLQRRNLVVVLRARLPAQDRERWAVYLVALARLDPHPPAELAALSAVLMASDLVHVEVVS